LNEQALLLRTAQIAEEKINELIFKEYCRENHDFAEEESRAQERIAELFNKASGVLNSDQDLCKVSFLRDGKLFSDFRRLHDRLFGKPSLGSDDDDPLHEIIEELESLRSEVIRCETFVSKLETEQEIESTKYLEKPTLNWRTTPIDELITQNEGYNLEFKETLEFSIKKSERDRSLIKESLKAIDAFLNTDGGTLLIGVSDTGVVKGLDRDFKFVDKNNKQDGFQLKLRSLIYSRFNPSPFEKVEIIFKELQDCIVCRINIEASYDRPIALDNEFYVRDGNCTRKLEGPDLVSWTQRRLS
jgi:hypothetical protein